MVESYEPIRRWPDKLEAGFAYRVKAARRKPGGTRHLDEVFATPRGEPWVPGTASGESDVVVSGKRTKPWPFVVSADNSGTDETGRYIGNVSLALYSLLGVNDVLSGGFNQDLQFGNDSLGTHGWNTSYVVPCGYWTDTLYGYANTYYQQLAQASQIFVASGNAQTGNAQTAGLKLERVIQRSLSDVSGVEFQPGSSPAPSSRERPSA